jgi:hypothetical protein
MGMGVSRLSLSRGGRAGSRPSLCLLLHLVPLPWRSWGLQRSGASPETSNATGLRFDGKNLDRRNGLRVPPPSSSSTLSPRLAIEIVA